MGTLIVMTYPTSLFAKAADHTYIKCGTGKKAWSCWGGKTGGEELRRGTGSTQRADKIAQPDEKAGIKCYLINGVCHQAANRILLPAGITVRGARGYNLSEAIYGPYGRVGFWPCKSPFNQYPRITGEIQACLPQAVERSRRAPRADALSDTDKLDWNYIQGALELYKDARVMLKTEALTTNTVEKFHINLFMYMAEHHLGPMLTGKLTGKLKQVRRKTEKDLLKTETAYAKDKMAAEAFVDAVNKATIDFQDELANAMTAAQYETLINLKPDDRVVLADPEIVSQAFDRK